MGKFNFLGKFVLFSVDGNNARTFPGANKKSERGQLNWQTLRKFEQLLLPLEELVENESRNASDGNGSQDQKAGEKHFKRKSHTLILPWSLR
mgnify:CR=1 FL=1